MRIAIAVVALLLVGCSAASPQPSSSPSPTATTAVPAELLPGEEWVFTGGTVTPDPASFGVTVAFDGSELSGKGPVNRYNATVTVGPSVISMGPIAATKMAGPDDALAAEQAYFAALQNVSTWEVADETLSLTDGAGIVLVYAAPGSPGAFAVSLIGQSTKQAKAAIAEAGYEARVVSVDGDVRPVTMDYRPDRINVTIVDKVVTNATVG
jgi:heat shock protein HslJ